jgi:hypothetical protein
LCLRAEVCHSCECVADDLGETRSSLRQRKHRHAPVAHPLHWTAIAFEAQSSQFSFELPHWRSGTAWAATAFRCEPSTSVGLSKRGGEPNGNNNRRSNRPRARNEFADLETVARGLRDTRLDLAGRQCSIRHGCPSSHPPGGALIGSDQTTSGASVTAGDTCPRPPVGSGDGGGCCLLVEPEKKQRDLPTLPQPDLGR